MRRIRQYIADMGISERTLYNWIDRGWIELFYVAGIPYITEEAHEAFVKAHEGEKPNKNRFPKKQPDRAA